VIKTAQILRNVPNLLIVLMLDCGSDNVLYGDDGVASLLQVADGVEVVSYYNPTHALPRALYNARSNDALSYRDGNCLVRIRTESVRLFLAQQENNENHFLFPSTSESIKRMCVRRVSNPQYNYWALLNDDDQFDDPLFILTPLQRRELNFLRLFYHLIIELYVVFGTQTVGESRDQLIRILDIIQTHFVYDQQKFSFELFTRQFPAILDLLPPDTPWVHASLRLPEGWPGYSSGDGRNPTEADLHRSLALFHDSAEPSRFVSINHGTISLIHASQAPAPFV
jgi:hypothetical protein